MAQRWLVTGGAGYIGAHTVRALRARGDAVVVLDDLSAGLTERVDDDVPLVRASVLDEDAVAATLTEHRLDGVLHFAARKSVPESVAHPLYYWRENVEGLRSVLAACARAGVERFVYSSSAAVYGATTGAAVAEDDPLRAGEPVRHHQARRRVAARRRAPRHRAALRRAALLQRRRRPRRAARRPRAGEPRADRARRRRARRRADGVRHRLRHPRRQLRARLRARRRPRRRPRRGDRPARRAVRRDAQRRRRPRLLGARGDGHGRPRRRAARRPGDRATAARATRRPSSPTSPASPSGSGGAPVTTSTTSSPRRGRRASARRRQAPDRAVGDPAGHARALAGDLAEQLADVGERREHDPVHRERRLVRPDETRDGW